MPDLIVQLLTWVLSPLLPRPRGRHRAGHLPAPPPFLVPPPPPRFTERLDGSASRLVRPYVLAAEAGA